MLPKHDVDSAVDAHDQRRGCRGAQSHLADPALGDAGFVQLSESVRDLENFKYAGWVISDSAPSLKEFVPNPMPPNMYDICILARISTSPYY